MMPDQNGPSRAGGATGPKAKSPAADLAAAPAASKSQRVAQPGALDRATIGKASR
jgi:hypothetical protein